MQLPADYPLKIIPVNFGVKFNPPKLGLEFTNVGQPHIQHIHEISLQGYIERQVDVDQIVDSLFAENKQYLHPRVIAKVQVKRLVERVIARNAKHKENTQQRNP
mgnify:CR=1 FL=1